MQLGPEPEWPLRRQVVHELARGAVLLVLMTGLSELIRWTDRGPFLADILGAIAW
jgi:hypothetical protein